MDQLEREEQNLKREHENGDLTLKEYNHELLELHRDYQIAAEGSAQDAYDREMDRW